MMGEILSPAPKDLPPQSFKEFVATNTEAIIKSHRFDTMIPKIVKEREDYSYCLFDVGGGCIFVLEYGCAEKEAFARRGRFYFKDSDDHHLGRAEIVIFDKDQERQYDLAYGRYGKVDRLKVNLRDRHLLNIPIALLSYNSNSKSAEHMYLAAEDPNEVKKFYSKEEMERKKIETHPPGAEISLDENANNGFLFIFPGDRSSAGVIREGEVFGPNLVTNPYSYEFIKKPTGAMEFHRCNVTKKITAILTVPSVNFSDIDYKMRHQFEGCKTIDKTYRPIKID
jgi:hypothetical protein